MSVWARNALIFFGCAISVTFLIHNQHVIDGKSRLQARTTRRSGDAVPLGNFARHISSTTTHIAEEADAKLATQDWRSQFAASPDLFAFVKRAVNPGIHGDGYAALYVERALIKCSTAVAEFGSNNPDAALQKFVLAHTNGPIARNRIRRYFDLCKGFFKGNTFATLPARKGGYFSYSYWMNEAHKDHNPVAEVAHVATLLPATGNGTDHRAIESADRTLASVVASGEPQAVFNAGLLLVNSHGSDLIRAFAVSMAGCDLGYDCSANNQRFYGNCAQAGTCAPGMDFADTVTQAVGPAGYAKAYELAQQLKFAIARGDTATVEQFTQLKR